MPSGHIERPAQKGRVGRHGGSRQFGQKAEGADADLGGIALAAKGESDLTLRAPEGLGEGIDPFRQGDRRSVAHH